MPRWRRRQLRRTRDERLAYVASERMVERKEHVALVDAKPVAWLCDCPSKRTPNQLRCKKCRKRRPW